MNENEIIIQQTVNRQLNDFNNAPIPTHTHNSWDAGQLDPVIALLGFPVYQVADASVAPTDQYDNGKFRFLVDFTGGTAHYYLWAYLVYLNASNQQIAKWVKVQLT